MYIQLGISFIGVFRATYILILETLFTPHSNSVMSVLLHHLINTTMHKVSSPTSPSFVYRIQTLTASPTIFYFTNFPLILRNDFHALYYIEYQTDQKLSSFSILPNPLHPLLNIIQTSLHAWTAEIHFSNLLLIFHHTFIKSTT